VQDESVLFPGAAGGGSMLFPGAPAGIRPDGPDAAKDSSHPPGPPKGSLPDEDVRKKAHCTFQEFLSIRDYREAETCILELAPSAAQEALIVSTMLQVRR
jgi:hypothetical protein